MNDLAFKNFEIAEHKSDNDGNLTIKGYGAVFGNKDSADEIIEKGAFQKTLLDRKERIAFCYQHDIWNPIGKITSLIEDEKGLKIEVKLSSSEKDIQTKVKEGILKEMSIGYRVMASKQETREGEEVTILTEVKLLEVSLVTVAANPLAIIESMKGEEKRDYITSEFDRLISIVRNENIKFEINKLKSLFLEFAPPKESKKEDALLSKDDLVTALVGGKSEMLNALKK